MHYVYLLRSVSEAKQKYIGVSSDLRKRIAEHNAGNSKHTAKFAPWKLVVYVAFNDRADAIEFEKYLKSGSGRAFASRHLDKS